MSCQCQYDANGKEITSSVPAPGTQGQAGPAIFLSADAIDGDQGSPGQAGSPGSSGSPGAPGAQGITVILDGDTGEEGPRGASGPPGIDGSPGSAGSPGPQGQIIFLEADMGEEGLRGPPGATGPQGPAGGGGGGTTGTATINFGATPVDSATVVVTGQAGITATSAVRAFFLDDTTGDNDAQAHLQAGALMPLVVGNRVVATGFTIYADVIAGMVTGQFKCTFAY